MDEKVKDRMGRVAYIRYKGGVPGDDELFEDHSTGNPVPVTLGAHRVPKGIENALFDMEVGEQRVIQIPSELVFGVYIEKDAQWYPRTLIPHGYEMKVGEFLPYTDPQNGLKKLVRVIAATEDGVKIDFNHPFAGKDLEYWIELVDLK